MANYNLTQTGAQVQAILNTVAAGYIYMGTANLTTTPDTTNSNVCYLLTAVGTYTNFGNITHSSGIGIALWNGSAWSYQNVPSETLIYDILNGSSTTTTTTYSDTGYYKYTDGSLTGVGGTWIHSPLIPLSDFVSAGLFHQNNSVANVAYYATSELSSYISAERFNGGVSKTKSQLTIPSNANYVGFSTDGSRYTLSVTTTTTEDGLLDVIEQLQDDVENSVKVTSQNLTDSQKAQARANIGIVQGNKYVHFSLDDCTFWADLIINANTYTSAFENANLAKLKQWHEAYGHCYTLNCFIVATINSVDYSIANVPSKFASEFQANKDWLRFAFHGTTTDETFSSTDATTLKGYYDTFVSGIFTMTGTYDCIDRVTRTSSFSGSKANLAAIRDTNCGITGLLTNDRNVTLSAGGSYYLTSAQNVYIHNHDKLYDPETMLWFIRSQTRIEGANTMLDPSVLNSAIYANFRPFVEMFWHETANWKTDYWWNTWMKAWFDYLRDNGYINAFTSDIMHIN